jgi:hypothetical protein
MAFVYRNDNLVIEITIPSDLPFAYYMAGPQTLADSQLQVDRYRCR